MQLVTALEDVFRSVTESVTPSLKPATDPFVIPEASQSEGAARRIVKVILSASTVGPVAVCTVSGGNS